MRKTKNDKIYLMERNRNALDISTKLNAISRYFSILLRDELPSAAKKFSLFLLF